MQVIPHGVWAVTPNKSVVYVQSSGNWNGIVGGLKAGSGAISDTQVDAVIDALSVDRYSPNHQWTQIALYRGTVGDLSGGCPNYSKCVRNLNATANIYTEAMRQPACAGSYFIFDWGAMTDNNMAFWNYYTNSWTDSCGQTEYQFSLAKTYPNGLPQQLTGGTQKVANSGQAAAALEVHNFASVFESTQGENCFGSVWYGACASNSQMNGLHLYKLSDGTWPLWTSSVDGTNGTRYVPATYCASGSTAGNPYHYTSFATYWAFKANGPTC